MRFKKTIAVVDDEYLFRRGIISLLGEYKQVEVLFEADNGKDLLDKLKVRKPEVILLDVEMPVMDGVEATEKIRERYPDIKIIILTSSRSTELMYTLMEKGANAFLTKNTETKVITKAINEVIEKGFYFDYEISKALANGIIQKGKQKTPPSYNKLSNREMEVIRLICQQFTNREIADKLCLSPRTIDTYRESILEKTGCKNAVGVAIYAVKYKLFDFVSL
jgi:DNA-binding NarL/FixJ family response regulator